MNVAVSGGTGFIGGALVQALKTQGHAVRVLTRTPELATHLPAGVTAVEFNALGTPSPKLLDGIDAVVHLAGESVAQRWTPEHKVRVMRSRIEGTQAILTAARAAGSVRTMISASAIGYYGAHGAEELTEDSAPGTDFLADVCVSGERVASTAKDAGIRWVGARIGVVLGPDGGALKQMLVPFKLGVGGRLGSGEQYTSWIHRDDLVALFLHALKTPTLSGPVNATAPNPVTNAEFTVALGHALHRPTLLPTPALALKLAFGEMSSMLLTGQRVMPVKALASGFTFRYPRVEDALAEIFKRQAA